VSVAEEPWTFIAGFDPETGLETEPERRHPRPEILVVGGGKGGVGKTCVAVNLSVEIARKGWRVVLVDADLSCSNVEMVLGTHSPACLDDFFYAKGRKELEPVVCDTPYENLRLIPGTSGLIDVANPRFQKKQALIRELQQLDADLIIIDLDAGAHLNTLDFFLLAETNGVMVITPEKTSIDNAFKFVRAALYRRIERFYNAPEVAVLLKRAATIQHFIDALHTTPFIEGHAKDTICGEIVAIARSLKPKVIVNRSRTAYEAQIAYNILRKYLRRDLLVEPINLGHLLFDPCVQESVNSGKPYVVAFPDEALSACISDVANRLGYF
jgi:flagellar biosynthesis protein FlhG